MTSDVNRIARNTGVPVKDIIKIKNYLFMDMHDLLGGHRYFDASFHIAQSWQRLMYKDGKDIKPHDMTLIKHELYEMGLVESGIPQDDAHNATSKIYDYKKESMNIMLKLTEIKRKGNLISAHVVSVDPDPDIFDIVVDYKKEELVNMTKDCQDMYTSMAMSKLIEVAEKSTPSNTPKSAVTAWF